MATRAATPKTPRVEFDHAPVVDPTALNLNRSARSRTRDDAPYERDAISSDASSYRRRTRHSEPLNFADDVLTLTLFTCDAVHAFGALLDDAFPQTTGRPRAHPRFVFVALDATASMTGQSIRKVFRQIGHARRWAEIRQAVAAARGIELPERPPTVDQHAYFLRNHIKEAPDLAARYDEMVKTDAIKTAQLIGCGANEHRTSSTPDPSAVLYGDATWVHTMYKLDARDDRARRVDHETGEITARRVDPDARAYHGPDGGGVGSYWAIGQMTNGNPHERVILFMDPIDRDDKDGDYCAKSAIRLKEHGLSVHGVGYDMALDIANVEGLQIQGIMPITKVRRDQGGKLAHRLIPQQEFKLADGTTETIDVHALDGAPYITGHVDGIELWFRLDRIKWEPRRGCAFTVYRVPDIPGPTTRLRGATVRIRTTSTEAEIARSERRGRALRPISQADAAFRDLYGPREGVESTNAHWKNTLPGRRQRTVGRTAQRFNANGYQLAQNLKAALAWHLRTGGDLSCIWRNGIPPGILPDPVGLAA